MERFDAVVVGAGPAGSTAAHRLAAAGARVLLLDRARFPRDKPCGGGLTFRAARLLPCPIDPVVEDEIATVEFGLAYGRRFERTSHRTLALMTQRRRLDAYLAERAAEEGADFRAGVKVERVDPDGDAVTVVADGTRIAAAAVLGADGVNGVTARALGPAPRYEYGVALEGNLPYDGVGPEHFRGRLVLELCVAPGGYGWIFPKADHANVGVGGWASEAPRLRAHLERLCAERGLRAEDLVGTRGYRLPLRRPGSPLARGRVALVGDAAGLVDPLTGDGIYEALLSAKLAAEATLDLLAGRTHELDGYATAMKDAVGPLHSASWGMKAALDRFPRATFAIARTPPAWGVIERLVRGELAHPGAARGVGRLAMRALNALAREAGDPGRAYRLETAAS